MRILRLILCAICMTVLLCGCFTPAEEASIGIIGGADGPTAIMVAEQALLPLLLKALPVVLIVVVTLIVILVYKNR